MSFHKNVGSQKWIVFAFDETDSTPKAGDAAQITAKIQKDWEATPSAITDTNPTEIEDGYYMFDLTQEETNADVLLILPESSTADIGVIGVPGVIFTQPQYFGDMGIESDGDLTKVNTLDGHTAQTGDNYARLGAPAGASIAADIAENQSDLDDILADTNELQTDWADGGRLDLLIDGIKTKTDSLAFTVAGHVDSNPYYLNGTELTGDGTAGTPWGPA